MGFAQFMNDQAERSEAAKFGFAIRDGEIMSKHIAQRDVRGPLAGATAEVIHGTDEARLTATRVLMTGPLALLWKKKTTKVFVIVRCADGVELVSELDAKSMEGKARTWAARFTSKNRIQ